MLVGSDSRRVSVTRNTEPARRIRASVSGVSIGKELRPRRRAAATRARGTGCALRCSHGLMRDGRLNPNHGREYGPVCGKPQARPRAGVIGERGGRVDGRRKLIDWRRKQRSPALWAGLRNQSTRADGLLGGFLRLLRAFSRLGGLLVMLLVRGLGRGRGLLGGRRGGRRISGNNRTREQGQGNDWDELLEH